ncbi:MAG: hypothetical protein II384_08505 [Prevotella sp.]|nr:hypothetical protein [Prevotella sp.]
MPLPTAQGEAANHHSAAATCRSRPSQASAGTTKGGLYLWVANRNTAKYPYIIMRNTLLFCANCPSACEYAENEHRKKPPLAASTGQTDHIMP